jgi:hypothetical protein
MTVKRSKITGNFVAQCDECYDYMDFDEDDPFPAIPFILRRTGWLITKVKDKWQHYCPDCKSPT